VKAVERKIKEITVSDLYDWQVRGEKFQLIDVREENEFNAVKSGRRADSYGSDLRKSG
jgi:rhodanese-related sulfurtransferase